MTIELGKVYNTVCTRIVKSGIIVRDESGQTHLVHISKLSDNFIANIADVIEIGKPYRCIGVQSKDGKIELSIKDAKQFEPVHKSLDDMIKDCEKAYQDKTKGKNFKKNFRRRNRGSMHD